MNVKVEIGKGEKNKKLDFKAKKKRKTNDKTIFFSLPQSKHNVDVRCHSHRHYSTSVSVVVVNSFKLHLDLIMMC